MDRTFYVNLFGDNFVRNEMCSTKNLNDCLEEANAIDESMLTLVALRIMKALTEERATGGQAAGAPAGMGAADSSTDRVIRLEA